VTRQVTFLMFDAFGHGGVARTVVSLANRLADHHDVRVVSLYRRSAEQRYPLDPRVELEVLVDLHDGLGPVERVRARRPTSLRPVPVESRLDGLTDHQLRRRLGGMRSGEVLVSTRPSLHLAATTWAAPGVTLVGQDHKNFPTRYVNKRQAAVLRAAVPHLDAYVVLTNADAADYRRDLPDMTTRIEVIRNALPWPVPETAAALDSKVVVAAGRLEKEKGFDRLIDAFAGVAADHPDWRLHLHGEGKREPHLRTRIHLLGLDDQVLMPGHTEDFQRVLEDASAFAMTSRAEGFPMVLIEAMSAGLPLVAMDCPRGPGEIVDDGKNGFLVEDGDVEGFAEALRTLVEQDDVRLRCGRRAKQDVHRYDPGAITGEWLALLDSL
jgi:glycosyltransferase involved in cell wall biosynthesis